jgi:hypothetical protein
MLLHILHARLQPHPRLAMGGSPVVLLTVPLAHQRRKAFRGDNHAKMAELFGQKTMDDLRSAPVFDPYLVGQSGHSPCSHGPPDPLRRRCWGHDGVGEVCNQCDITIAGSTRVRNLEILAGTHIDAIRVYDGKDSKSCGRIEGGKPHPVNLNKNEYFVGFAGRSPRQSHRLAHAAQGDGRLTRRRESRRATATHENYDQQTKASKAKL